MSRLLGCKTLLRGHALWLICVADDIFPEDLFIPCAGCSVASVRLVKMVAVTGHGVVEDGRAGILNRSSAWDYDLDPRQLRRPVNRINNGIIHGHLIVAIVLELLM